MPAHIADKPCQSVRLAIRWDAGSVTSRVLDEIDHGIGERLNIVGIAAGDDVAVRDRCPSTTFAPALRRSVRIEGRWSPSDRATDRLDQKPRAVADRRDRLALRGEPLISAIAFIHAQMTGLRTPPGRVRASKSSALASSIVRSGGWSCQDRRGPWPGSDRASAMQARPRHRAWSGFRAGRTAPIPRNHHWRRSVFWHQKFGALEPPSVIGRLCPPMSRVNPKAPC